MSKNKQLFVILILAVMAAGAVLAVRIREYEPLFPKQNKNQVDINQLKIPVFPEDPIVGEKKSPVSITVFTDYPCIPCEKQNDLLKKLIQKYPKFFHVVWKGLPVTQFPLSSEPAHNYAYCAEEQNKFDEFVKMTFVNKDNLSMDMLKLIGTEIKINEKKLDKCINSPELKNYIEKNKKLAEQLNIQSVPTIFVNNVQIKNPDSLEEWEKLFQL